MKKINATPFLLNGSLSNHYPARSLTSLTNIATLIAACLFVKLADAQPGGGFGGGLGNTGGAVNINTIGGGAEPNSRNGGKSSMSTTENALMIGMVLGVPLCIALCCWQKKRIVEAYYDVLYGITCTLPRQLSACGASLENKIKNWRRTQPPTNKAGIEIPRFQQQPQQPSVNGF